MRFVLYTNSISAHQLPLAREIVKRVGAENFRYVYTNETLQGGNQEVASSEPWIIKDDGTWLEDCDVLLCGGLRPFDLFERRVAKGLKTFYQSERWFKPIHGLPGWLRLLHPGYLKMVCRFKLLAADRNFHVLPIGPHAKRDFRLLGIPDSKMIDWGYFVAPSEKVDKFNLQLQLPTTTKPLRVLWVGRMIGWKRVDTIVKAVRSLDPALFSLTLVGYGAERDRLIRMSAGAENIFFMESKPINQIREIMRAHDVYVLSSNGEEGWGAALNEAMEEGMMAFGTIEAGASAALLPQSHLFRCGDWHALAERLVEARKKYAPTPVPSEYTPAIAARRLLGVCL